MKKLFSLALLAIVAFVIVGCEKSTEDKMNGAAGAAGAAATNAMPK